MSSSPTQTLAEAGHTDLHNAAETAIATIPVKATGAEVDTGTDDAKFVTSKAIEDSSYVKTTVLPVKATNTEINTGTDDAKFATPLAIAGSNYGKLLGLSMAKAYCPSDISLSDSVAAKVTNSTEVYDVGGNYDAANSKYVVPTGGDGYYEVITQVDMYSGTGAVLGYAWIYLNGSPIMTKVETPPAAPQFITLIWTGHLVATDYLEVYCQKNAASWKVYGNSASTWVSIRQLTKD